MGTLSDAYFARIQTIITELRTLLSDLPPESTAPILAQLAQMEAILKHQEPPVE